jgi:hypothetical protein
MGSGGIGSAQRRAQRREHWTGPQNKWALPAVSPPGRAHETQLRLLDQYVKLRLQVPTTHGSSPLFAAFRCDPNVYTDAPALALHDP